MIVIEEEKGIPPMSEYRLRTDYPELYGNTIKLKIEWRSVKGKLGAA